MAQPAITDLKAWPVRQPQDKLAWTVIRVDTDAGVSGWGEAPPGCDAVEAGRSIIGADATAAESVRLRLKEPLLQGAVNMALLDILGKLCKAPVYEVLGGPTRTKARAMTTLRGATEAEWIDSLKGAKAAGFRAVTVPLARPDGPSRGRAYFRDVRRTLDRLREAGGEDVDFVLDCGPDASVAEAAGLARELESFHLLWIEAPGLPARAIAEIAAGSSTPVGRSEREVGAFQELLRSGSVDALRPDIALWGITAIKKVAALAETYYAAVAPAQRGGPIATAAALHLAASIPNFVIQELPRPADEKDRKMRLEIAGAPIEAAKDGWLALPTGPGLGVAPDLDALARYRIP